MEKTYQKLSEREELIATDIVDCAFKLHSELGPGLLEKVYEICMAHLLEKRGYKVKRQVIIPIVYDGIQFDEGLRLDLLVEDIIVCEIKSLESVNPVWTAQVLTQLKLSGRKLGFLINFNVPLIKAGITRLIN